MINDLKIAEPPEPPPPPEGTTDKFPKEKVGVPLQVKEPVPPVANPVNEKVEYPRPPVPIFTVAFVPTVNVVVDENLPVPVVKLPDVTSKAPTHDDVPEPNDIDAPAIVMLELNTIFDAVNEPLVAVVKVVNPVTAPDDVIAHPDKDKVPVPTNVDVVIDPALAVIVVQDIPPAPAVMAQPEAVQPCTEIVPASNAPPLAVINPPVVKTVAAALPSNVPPDIVKVGVPVVKLSVIVYEPPGADKFV